MYKIWLSRCDADSGSTTNLISCSLETPIALTASMGSVSTASIASYCNFAINPTVYIMIASTPAKGPKPTIITNKIAQSIEGKVRVAASRARIGT